MAGQGFIARINGAYKQLFGLQVSAGAADAGKLVALNSDGVIDPTMLNVGANTVAAITTEALSAGDFVELYDNAGVLSVRKADNSNNRKAWGFVKAAVASSGTATAYRLNNTNASRSGLTPGGSYWLGTAGGVINTPLDPATQTGKTCQFLGVAKSATELVTVEYDPVLL